MKRIEMQVQCGDALLAGTLHLPDSDGPHPAIVMLQGSGTTNRDAEGYFLPFREQFLGRGVAALSWDRPGVGESSGDWRQQTLYDRADEALDAIAWLRSRPEIDPARVGIWGHSQGGWIGPLAASQAPDVAFLIVNSGPGIGMPEQNLYGIEHVLRRDGASEEDIAQALAFMNALNDAASQQVSYEQVVTNLLEPARGTPAESYFGELSEQDWPFFVLNAQRPYDPVPSLERITCPVLALFGERDPLVPAAESAAIFERAFAVAGNADVTIHVFPDADHRIRTGEPPEFVPGYLTLMADWLEQHTKPR
ncbi:MAG TPA: alpha/beta fold hydrolase [Thermomicrobiales bacterium]|nr:alpha/beta fold hydrolase [Thermomicrobiales bacterium]